MNVSIGLLLSLSMASAYDYVQDPSQEYPNPYGMPVQGNIFAHNVASGGNNNDEYSMDQTYMSGDYDGEEEFAQEQSYVSPDYEEQAMTYGYGYDDEGDITDDDIGVGPEYI